MCLAIPGKILEIKSDVQPIMAIVSFGGVRKEVCLEWLPEAKVGDYVLVHVGFAISMVDEDEAIETLRLIDDMESAHELQQGGDRRESPETRGPGL